MPSIKKQRPRVTAKKTGSLRDRIVPIDQVKSGLTFNIYGRSGTGKTRFACTFPKPLMLIGAENGTQSVTHEDGAQFFPLRTSAEIAELLPIVEEDGYKTVVLDTASVLQDLVLKEILGLQTLPAQLSWGLASQQDWGQVALQMKERLRSLLMLAEERMMYVVIIAQEREFNTDTTSDVIMPFVASALSPSVVGWLNPACNYICQTFVRQRTEMKDVTIAGKTRKVAAKSKEVEFCLRVAPDPTYTTKFRLPKGAVLPDAIVDPSFEKVHAIVTQRS